MNKVISTNERIFMCISGASGTGKTQLILSMLTGDGGKHNTSTFEPPFKRIYYFYKHFQPVYNVFTQRLNEQIEFVQCSSPFNFDIVQGVVDRNAQNVSMSDQNVQQILFIFDDSCDEILQCPEFADLATAGRHRGIHVIFVKHNIYHQGKYSVTVDKNTTHTILMKSPRIGKQLKILGSEIDGASATFLTDCYKKATQHRYGHLLIDESPSCNPRMKFSSNIIGGEEPTLFWSPDREAVIESLDNDVETNALYAASLSRRL